MLRQVFSARQAKLFLLTGDIEGITDHLSTRNGGEFNTLPARAASRHAARSSYSGAGSLLGRSGPMGSLPTACATSRIGGSFSFTRYFLTSTRVIVSGRGGWLMSQDNGNARPVWYKPHNTKEDTNPDELVPNVEDQESD
jgi:hypothetical protein